MVGLPEKQKDEQTIEITCLGFKVHTAQCCQIAESPVI